MNEKEDVFSNTVSNEYGRVLFIKLDVRCFWGTKESMFNNAVSNDSGSFGEEKT